jgi:hypothetical protein
MKHALRSIACLLFAALIYTGCARPAEAQSLEVRAVRADYGWHGVGGDLQVHQPTLEFSAPWVGVWERWPASPRYGDWRYVKVLINCDNFTQIPFATLSPDGDMQLVADATGADPAQHWPDPGTVQARTIDAVCNLFGYVHQVAPVRHAESSIGKIRRIDKP